jgi:[ribosomal protein S5]-alanine N-acetyltransferase
MGLTLNDQCQPQVIQTARLTLRPLTLADVDAILAIIGDPIAMQFYPRTFTRKDAVEWVERNQRRYENEGCGILAMALKGTVELIGDCGIVRQTVEEEPMLEVGYHLRRDQWGHGYATEAARACMDYAFSELAAVKVVSLIRPENTPSRRVAERNGMQVERQVMHDGLPHLLYVMKRETYGQT